MFKQIWIAFIINCLLLTFAVPSFAAIDDTGFLDVTADIWYAEAVVYCRDHGR